MNEGAKDEEEGEEDYLEFCNGNYRVSKEKGVV